MSSNGFFSNWIVRNILWAVIVVAILVIGSQIFLALYTRHGNEISVPDLTALSQDDAARMAELMKMRVEVVDSIYVKRMPRGSVVRQEPAPGVMVKEGRRIQLTLNAVAPKKIPMPNLVGYSYRSAMAELSARGLEVGKLIYVADIATNNVLSQLYRNSEIRPGAMIPCESQIDLVLGLDASDSFTVVPNLNGTKCRRAIDLIHESSLNVGSVVYDRSVRTYSDSLNAVVYRQNPPAATSGIVKGRTVSIYLKHE